LKTGWLLALFALSCAGPLSNEGAAERISLTPGEVCSRTLAGGKPHRFRFEAPADLFLHLTIEQRGVDVVVLLKDPADRLLYEADSPGGAQGPETIWAVTSMAGEYVLAVEPLVTGKGGAFDLKVDEARPAREEDRRRAASHSAFARAERRRLDKDFESAVPAYRQALPGFAALGDRAEVAQVQWRLGKSLLATGELVAAGAALEQSVAGFRSLGEGLGEARALNDLGDAWRLLGEPGRALQAHERSLHLYRQARVPEGQATALNELGLALESRGDLQGAIDRYREALILWRRLGSRRAEAVTLQNLGNLYILIGHDDEGMDLLRQALALLEGAGERERLPVLIGTGWAYYLAGRPEPALGLYRQAIEIARKLGDRKAEAGAWDRRGSALRAVHRYDEAAASYSRALAISRTMGSQLYQGHTLANLGWLDLETGSVERSRQRLGKAADLLKASGDPNGEAFARVGLSRAERHLGSFAAAREQIEVAVRLVEEVRTGLEGSMSRGQFLSTRYDVFEELVALLMDLHRRDPAGGYDRQALEVAERARARNLAEQLVVDRELQRADGREARRRILRGEIRAMEERRQALALHNPRDPRLQDIDAELRERSLELDRLAAATAGSLSGPRPLTAARIQELADQDSLIVVYLLAEPESFAWVVDRHGIEPRVLPGRDRIQKLARRVVAALSQKRQVAAPEAAARAVRELSQAVLAPLGEDLAERRRLVILADGALHLVPFEALPEPGARSEPLLVDHEIVMLPSATFLVEQRRRLAHRRPAPGAVAVLADPVFSAGDERLARSRGRAASSTRTSTQSLGLGPFERLPYTAREAEAILRLVPRQKTLAALGTAACLDLVTSGALRRYRIVHFATHGLLHPVLPERSGLVLSLYDAEGRHQDGFLSAPEVADLDLPAELVVLSACQTGLGRELRGEGLVGLTQAFFRAGARRVVVSRWSVQDRATAELMARFYRGLLAEHLPPVAALRAAQLSIRSEPDWQSPFFWAGFSLHGDWH
jgi:CHAT domain-containing protein